MSAKTSDRLPKYRHHKATGQGYVVLNGLPVYLGLYERPESLQSYHQTIAEWLACGRQPRFEPEQLTVKELIARFYTHARTYYVDAAGEPTSQLAVFRAAFKPLKQLYADSKVMDITPLCLKAVRQRMVDQGWARTTVNQGIGRIKRMFRWGVENELVPGGTFHALQALSGLRRGRCGVRETEGVRPVPMPLVNAIKPFVSRQVWALVQMQLLTAARAGELVIMRPCDVDRSGKVWIYRPAAHKTAHHGHSRYIYIGPQAQRELSPFLVRSAEAYCFSPAEAEKERLELRHAARVTPLDQGNAPGTNKKERRRRPPSDRYDVATYRRAIERASDRAFPPPEGLAQQEDESREAWRKRLTPEQKKELTAWRKQHRWHPHQLRHNAATELRREFGLDAARVILGHRSPAITDLYAEIDHEKAVDAMLRVG